MTTKWISLFTVVLFGWVASVQAAEVKAGALSIDEVWARASAGSTSGVFLTIRNDGDADRLVAITSKAAGAAELHTTTKEGDVMKMRQVDGLDIPAHGSVALQPGGYHIMLLGLKSPLKAGATVPLSLQFKKAGNVEVVASVRKLGAAGMADHQHMMMDHSHMMDHPQ